MGDSKKIVLIEDQETWRFIYRCWLKDIKDVTVSAEFEMAEDALDQMEKIAPDVAIVDISLPGMSGLDFVKKAHQFPGLKVILVSGFEKTDLCNADLCGLEIYFKGNTAALYDAIVEVTR